MLAAASLLVAAAAAAAPTVSPAADYPLEAVLTAARSLCTAVSSVEDVEAGRLPPPWRAMAQPEAWAEKYRAGLEHVVAGYSAKARVVAAVVDAHMVWAFVGTSKGPSPHPTSTTCEVVDREAAFAPDDARLARWAGRAPFTGNGVLQGLSTWVWRPGLDPDLYESEVVYVTASAAKNAGLRSGLTYLTVHISRPPAP